MGVQTQVGVAGAQEETALGAGGEHTIGFIGALGDKVINHHAEVGFVARKNEGSPTLLPECGVDPGVEALGGGLFVARGAIDLSSEVEVWDLWEGEALIEGTRVNAVVLNGIGIGREVSLLQTWNGADQLPLDLLRERVGETIWVAPWAIRALRLQDDVVPSPIAKLDDFILNTWAISDPLPGDLAAVECRGC